MIKSKNEYKYYLNCDRLAKGISRPESIFAIIQNLLYPNYVWNFQRTLRKVEYFKNCRKDVIGKSYYVFLYKKFKRLSLKLGFSIPLNVFGPGLSIAHYGTIVINSNVKIGANCRIHTCVNIGTRAGFGDKAPVIGDNCYIGPGVKIYGNIKIADNVAIIPNSVVNKSFIENNIAIAGLPAKKLININTFSLIIPSTIIIQKNLVKEVEKLFKKGGNYTKDIYDLVFKEMQ